MHVIWRYTLSRRSPAGRRRIPHRTRRKKKTLLHAASTDRNRTQRKKKTLLHAVSTDRRQNRFLSLKKGTAVINQKGDYFLIC